MQPLGPDRIDGAARLAGALRSVLLLLGLALAGPAAAELRGHGGPVRAVAVLADGTLVSGGFDTAVIRWDAARASALQVLRFHQGSVNAVVALPDGRFASAGEDSAIAIWSPDRGEPDAVLRGHQAPVVALAARGTLLASAAWDRTVRIWDLSTGSVTVLEGHADNVNGVAFLPDGRVASAAYDATIRIWRADGTADVATIGVALNALAAATDGTLHAAGADGRLHVMAPDGAIATIQVGTMPLITVAVDATRVAAGGLRGSVSVFRRADRVQVFSLEGPGLPVWSVAFTQDGARIVTGGTDRRVRLWDATTGRHVGAVVPDDDSALPDGVQNHPGAEVWRACQACHTLGADSANRAGPSLRGVLGRRIASLPGYAFSPALRGMDIVWSPETVSRLFEVGPNAYLPGTKMPEQVLGEAERAALVDFLARAAGP
jgi:cytochrome c